jgi:hypothetical protein
VGCTSRALLLRRGSVYKRTTTLEFGVHLLVQRFGSYNVLFLFAVTAR